MTILVWIYAFWHTLVLLVFAGHMGSAARNGSGALSSFDMVGL
jgi:hypothetical protein